MKDQIKDFSTQLKIIAKDISFLGQPRYPLKELNHIFPEHKDFILQLQDVSVPFEMDAEDKNKKIDELRNQLMISSMPNDVKNIFINRLKDYEKLIVMMNNFGTDLFYENCVELYGSSQKLLNDKSLYYFIEEISSFCHSNKSADEYQGEVALNYLRRRLEETFHPRDFEIKSSTSLLSDSSAGRRTLKLNPNKSYSKELLDIFLVHEGWVHLGTSLNGTAQEDNPWLSTWAPRTTHLQEGLAIVTELISGKMTQERWNKVVLRHLATALAEKGSSIKEVYSYLRHNQLNDLDAFKLALRIFRGVPLEGGRAFTKELLYIHGTIQLLQHLKIKKANLSSVWVGKISFDEHLVLLNNWELLNPQIKYFPEELRTKSSQLILDKLIDLTTKLFTNDLPSA